MRGKRTTLKSILLFIGCVFLTALLLHTIASGVWYLSQYGERGRFAIFVHNAFFFPIVLAEFHGLSLTPDGLRGLIVQDSFPDTLFLATLGPNPSAATFAWCLIVATAIAIWRLRIRNHSNFSESGQPDRAAS